MTIEQRDSSLRVDIRQMVKGEPRKLSLGYKTAGQELHYTGLDGDDFRTKLQWRGDTLVFSIIELERGETIRSEEVWSWLKTGTNCAV